MKSVYVGNLPYSATEDEIKQLFAPYGEAQSVKLINDRETGRPKGFAFVTIDDAAAASAIAELDGKQFGGRRLRVNEARERAERPPRPFDGPRGGGRPSFGGSQGGFQRRDFGGPRGGGAPRRFEDAPMSDDPQA
jgi:RNA recognition motif-containing protein